MSGLRYELGRDMPPGMQEKFAVQIAQQLEEATTAAAQWVKGVIGNTHMDFTCAYCGAVTKNTEQIGDVAVHFCDACRERISREVKWERQGETWRKPNVICPYCGYELDSEDSALFFEVGNTEEYACEWCQRKFDVEVREVRYYSTNRSASEMPEDWHPPGGMIMVDRCVCCGAIIPEGRQVCPNCASNKRPCSRCKSPRPWLVKVLPSRGIFTRYFVECRSCHHCGPTRIGKHRAVKAWNRRA